MANKKQLKRSLKRIQRIKIWQLVVIFLISSIISATFLRLNNIGMVERRNAVINADNESDQAKIKTRLYELQHYVSSHMNTNMGKGIYLEKSYQAAIDAAYETQDDSSGVNVYKAVQEICMPRFAHWSQYYVNCVVEELAKFPEGKNLVSEIEKPNPDSFLHVYSSPLWSSDVAGWSVLFSVVILIMILVKIIGVAILNLMLKIKLNHV